MNILESFRVAFGGLVTNRLRSGLTMLGIVIGVGAVIGLVSFGQAFQTYVAGAFQSIGSNLLFVAPTRPSGPNAKTLKPQPLTMGDVAAISKPSSVPGLIAIAPQYNVTAKVLASGNSVVQQVNGATAAWQVVRDWFVTDGRFIEDTDVNTGGRVAVLGVTAVKKLFGAGSHPIGEEVRINGVPFRVIGILQEKGQAGGQDQTIVIPISTAQSRLGAASVRTSSGDYQVTAILAKTEPEQDSAAIKSRIEQILFDRHKIAYAGEEDYLVITEDQVLSIVGNVTGLLTIFLALIAGISLLVGGIGVMNIMLVSVTERTREIGLRKAVGARYRDLIFQFLIESVLLCLGGGAVGVLIGMLAAAIGSRLIPSLSLSVELPAVLLATGVSTAIGIFFGLYPASRAASLNPIEALRYE